MNARKWFPHLATLTIAVVLIVTQQAWASPLGERLAAVTANSKTTVNYQGFLTDSGGAPVNSAVDIVFSLYNVDSGGTALWTETQTGVPVSDGLFSVLLGSVSPLPQTLFAQNDNLWLGIAIGADAEMTPREKLASAPYAMAGTLPSGVIVMWSGQLANIPAGWALCNGANGTPDLRDRFVVGAGTSYAVGDTGGANQVTLTLNQIPAHTHGYSDQYTTGERDNGSHAWNATYDKNPRYTADNKTTSSAGGGQAHENRPPYYALAFICKQ